MTMASIGLLFAVLSFGAFAGSAAPGVAQKPAAPAPAVGRQAGRGRGAARPVHIPDAPRLDVRAVDNPLTLPPGTSFGVVAGVAVNSKGHVFVYQRTPVPLLEFDEHGRFLRALGESAAARPHSVRIDADDNVWLVDSGAHTVTKLSPAGDVLMMLGTPGVSGSGAEAASRPLFNIPSDVAIAANGDLFVAQGEGGGPDPRVIHFDRTGRFLNTWSLAYDGGPRSNPHAIAVDARGLVYVADRDAMRIRVFRPDGSPVREIQMANLVYGLCLAADGGFWIVTGTDGLLMRVAADGTVLGYTGRRGTGPGEFREAHMLALAPGGTIFVADTTGRKVEAFVPR